MPEIRDRITELRRVKASDLLANPKNWRKHPAAQSAALSAVLQEVGYADALLARETPEGLQLIDGHLRQKLTPDQDVPVLVLDVTEDEANKILLTLDPLASLAESDKQALDALLRDVTTGDAALQEMLSELAKDNGLTYGTQEVATAPEPEIDRAEELQKKWKVKLGEIWQAGRHTIVCDDYRTHNWPAQFVVTDPPYGINVDTAWLTALHVQRGKPANMSDDRLANDDGSLDLTSIFQAPKWAVWGFPYLQHESATGWMVWDKWPGTDGTGLGSPVELALSNLWTGLRLIRFMWAGYYRAEGEKRQPHPTQKPVGVMRPLIVLDKSDDIVTDPFMGSGSTVVACEELKRSCYGVELKPEYVSVTLERLQQIGLRPMPADRVKQQTYIVHSSVVPASSVV